MYFKLSNCAKIETILLFDYIKSYIFTICETSVLLVHTHRILKIKKKLYWRKFRQYFENMLQLSN